jgi:hypothetical protein
MKFLPSLHRIFLLLALFSLVSSMTGAQFIFCPDPDDSCGFAQYKLCKKNSLDEVCSFFPRIVRILLGSNYVCCSQDNTFP